MTHILSTRSPWIQLLGGPILWTLHFFISYGWVEFACQSRLLVLDSTILGLPISSHVVLLLTFAMAGGTGFLGWGAYRSWRQLLIIKAEIEASHWINESERFMAFSGILLSGLFGLVILVTGLPVLILRPC